ncbi:glycosyltransferase family 2 protein [Paenibacillus sp. NPDC058071]|uniref:glycosyltransferase family 2 protein n=1 Tax=Paenibacillus sp. NPDC058071 TaxID=3346326 RepID=UPI0036DF827E
MNGATGLTSIIIPTYNGLSWLREAVASISRCTPEPHEIIVVDNGSTDGTLSFLQEQNITFVSHPGNTGFPTACNWGLRMARGDYLLLLNDDVLVTDHWLGGMLDAFAKDPEIGIVGPLSNYVSGRQQVDMPSSYTDTAASIRKAALGQVEYVNRVIGFCMLISRRLLDRIGLLDEQFSPGHFEDDDYCYRARAAGFRIAIAKDVFIYHDGSASFKREPGAVDQLLARNRQLFVSKWGVDPHLFI